MVYPVIHEEVNCFVAEEFINKLSPLGEYFEKENLSSTCWLFRGQAENWDLKPSLYRSPQKIRKLTGLDVAENYSNLLIAERDMLLDFFAVADKRGLVIPDDSQELRSILDSVRYTNDGSIVNAGVSLMLVNEVNEWLTSGKVLSLLALAQHYGMPTRLLDWTLNPFIAAFFAAEGGVDRHEKEGNTADSLRNPLVVWAFKYPLFGIKTSWNDGDYVIKGVTAPRANNPNLAAQQGVFTLIHSSFTGQKEGNYLPLDQILKKIGEGAWSNKVLGCELRKFTLPVGEALRLLRSLVKLDITPSVVYPGYHSIVSDIEISKRWQRA